MKKELFTVQNYQLIHNYKTEKWFKNYGIPQERWGAILKEVH